MQSKNFVEQVIHLYLPEDMVSRMCSQTIYFFFYKRNQTFIKRMRATYYKYKRAGNKCYYDFMECAYFLARQTEIVAIPGLNSFL